LDRAGSLLLATGARGAPRGRVAARRAAVAAARGLGASSTTTRAALRECDLSSRPRASWESRHAIDALDVLARTTGETAWCAAIRPAASWRRVAGGCWARFYGPEEGQPMYRAASGARVETPAAARPGYDWRGDYGIPALLRRLALGASESPPAPLPGDPGACAAPPILCSPGTARAA